MNRIPRFVSLVDSLKGKTKEEIEKLIERELCEGDVLFSYEASEFYVWPQMKAVPRCFSKVEIDRSLTDKHEDALHRFGLLMVQLEHFHINTYVDLKPNDTGLVQHYGKLDSRIENVCYVHRCRNFYENVLVITVASKMPSITIGIRKLFTNAQNISDVVERKMEVMLSPQQSIILGLLRTPDDFDPSDIPEHLQSTFPHLTYVYPDMDVESPSFYSGFTETLQIENKSPVDVKKYTRIDKIDSNSIKIGEFLRDPKFREFIDIISISQQERIYSIIETDNCAISRVVETPVSSCRNREIWRHKTLFDVCLAFASLENVSDNVLLWIIDLLPLMHYWSAYKKMTLIDSIRRSVRKVWQARPSKQQIK